MSIAVSSRATLGAVLGLVWLAATACAQAQSATQSDEGFYVGVGLGPSKFDQSKQEFDAGLFGSFTSVGFTIVSPVSQLDDASTEFRGLLGYRFNSYFGFELAFMDIGRLNYSANMTLTGGGLPSPSPASISGDLSAKGPILAVIGTVPLRKRWRSGSAARSTSAAVSRFGSNMKSSRTLVIPTRRARATSMSSTSAW